MASLDPSMLDRADAPYWRGLAEGELRLPQCGACQTWIWPAQTRCKHCGAYDVRWRRVEPEAEVFSWTRTHLPFMPAFADLVPYVTVLAALPKAGGIRLLGRFTGDFTKLSIGARLKGTFVAPSQRTMNLGVITWDLASGSGA